MIATLPRFAPAFDFVRGSYFVWDAKLTREVGNGKGETLRFGSEDGAALVARIMNERVASLPTAVTAPRDEDNDGGYDSDDYPSDPPALLSTNLLSSMRGLFG